MGLASCAAAETGAQASGALAASGARPRRIPTAPPGVTVSQRRTLAVIAGLYLIEGFPGGALRRRVAGLPARERRVAGDDRRRLRALGGLGAQGALVAARGPLRRAPPLGGRRAGWPIALALLALAALDPIGAAARALASRWPSCASPPRRRTSPSTRTASDSCGKGEEGPANAMRVAAFRTALPRVRRRRAAAAALRRLGRHARGARGRRRSHSRSSRCSRRGCRSRRANAAT